MNTNDLQTSVVGPSPTSLGDGGSVDHERSASREFLARQLDEISLGQALVDFELANARVLDLIARLVEANDRARRFAVDVDVIRSEIQGVSDQRDRLALELIDANEELARASSQRLDLVAASEDSRSTIDHLRADVEALHECVRNRDVRVSELDLELRKIRSTLSVRVLNKLAAIARRVR